MILSMFNMTLNVLTFAIALFKVLFYLPFEIFNVEFLLYLKWLVIRILFIYFV